MNINFIRIHVVSKHYYLGNRGGKHPYFSPLNVFCQNNLFGVSYDHNCFKIRIYQFQHTFQIPRTYLQGTQKIFYETLKKKFQPKKGTKQLWWTWILPQILKKSLFSPYFLLYNLIGVSYDPDFCTDAIYEFQRTFQIPRTYL